MADTEDTFSGWLAQAQITEAHLTPQQLALLQTAFHFRQAQGSDYYSTRLLSHFLLHCDSGLSIAAIARLLGLSRPTASRQQGLSAKEAIRQAHHRLDGRPYGKLLPRYAGPIAQFLFHHADASRADLIDFIDRAFGVRVSRVALSKFLKKFGLDPAAMAAPPSNPAPAPVQQAAASVAAQAASAARPSNPAPLEQAAASATPRAVSVGPSLSAAGPSLPANLIPNQPMSLSPPPFSSHGRNTRAPSS
jgi:transposase